MGNSYFQFKQFRIQQQHAAMKVSTDACIQGAWTPIPPNALTALDIGCGTGLLTLMLAQRQPQLRIDAIEIDEDAAKDAAHNFRASPWAANINLLYGDARTSLPEGEQYDLVICNPPFFNNSLLGPQGNRNVARHTLTLSHGDLTQLISRHLSPTGFASVLLPPTEAASWNKLMIQQGLHLYTSLQVTPRHGKPANRVICVHTQYPDTPTPPESMVIYEQDNSYTPAARALLGAFYLYL